MREREGSEGGWRSLMDDSRVSSPSSSLPSSWLAGVFARVIARPGVLYACHC